MRVLADLGFTLLRYSLDIGTFLHESAKFIFTFPTLRAASGNEQEMKAPFTVKQGHYLAFIHYYTMLNDCPPTEADMQRYFRVTRTRYIKWCSRLE
jgi:hypothetical protein